MPTTRKKMADQVQYRLEGGYPSVAASVQYEDIIEALGQILNQSFKAEQFSVNLPSGETIPDGLMLMTYENISITTKGKRSYSILPAIPVSLPRSMGIFHIADMNEPDCGFIPMAGGQWQFLKEQPLINDILGQVGYEPYGNKVLYNKDLIAAGITSVIMRLVVFDMSAYDDFTIIPVPADMEDGIIDKAMAKLAGVPMPDKINSSVNEPTKMPAKQ